MQEEVTKQTSQIGVGFFEIFEFGELFLSEESNDIWLGL